MNAAKRPAPNADLVPVFDRISSDPYDLYLHPQLAPHARAIAIALRELGNASISGAGNRGSGLRFALSAGPELFVRRSRRGGAMRLLFDDLYFGFRPRTVVELEVAAEALRRGIPVTEPMGAAVRWIAPGFYRAFFITRAAAGMTLWDFVRTDDDTSVRAHVLQCARAAIETMLQQGLYHPDLNLQNLFVTPRGESFAVIILDLDKAWLVNHSIEGTARRRIAARLMRSVRKLDASGRFLDKAALSILNFV